MALLIIGILLWSLVHLSKSLAPGLRSTLIAKLGKGRYSGVFALGITAGVVLMVIGWRSSTPVAVYSPPAWGHSATIPLMYVALVLFFSARLPTNIKRVLRHPQLTGVALWGIAHLLANGDSRSVALFGGLTLWALIEMPLINRREGAWRKRAARPIGGEIVPLLVGVLAYAALFFLHPWIAGVRLATLG